MDASRPTGGNGAFGDGGPIGLALSGSGVKAALFHIGALARLAELDLLRRIDVISAVSGGALVAGLYHLHLKRALDADGEIDTPGLISLVAALERHFLEVVQTDLKARLDDNLLANLRRVRTGYTEASRLGDLLDRHLYLPVWNGDHTWPAQLRELAIHPRGDRDFNPVTDNRQRYCKVPDLVIQASGLETGRPWRFDAERMGEPGPSPAARRLTTAPRLTPSPYRRLPEAYAGMTLGHAVAASMAAPGRLEPLRLPDLYPDPTRPQRCLDLRLADGMITDPLATDVLIERGCSRCIVVSGDGLIGMSARAAERLRTAQLRLLEASRPGRSLLIHMQSESKAAEIVPMGPLGRGAIIEERGDDDLTSYGVRRKVQKTIGRMRADIDAPSEVEAMALMADGYLITGRAFHRLAQSGDAWTDGPPVETGTWRFSPVIGALGHPSAALMRHLRVAGHTAFRGPQLAIRQAVGLSLNAAAGILALIALGAALSVALPKLGDGILGITGAFLLALGLLGWRARRRPYVGAAASATQLQRLLDAGETVWTMVLALPRFVAGRFRRRASRAFLKVGRLQQAGIEPVPVRRRTTKAAPPVEPAMPERKAA